MSFLRAENITKTYPGTVALDNVSVSFESGRVHALIGKNGSGKSTLVKIFSGAVKPDGGDFYLDDKKIVLSNPEEAFDNGIATAYQEMSLISGLTVAENILLGRMPMKGILVDWKRTFSEAQKLLDDLQVDISSKALVSSLSMWQCQMVEIAKAVSHNPKVLMLDEPTSSLANHETELLFTLIRRLRDKGLIIIYISHRLQELWQIADSCTVLRDGRYVGSAEMSTLSRTDLVKLMFGEVEIKTRPSDLTVGEKVVLEVKNLTSDGIFEDISFKVREKEVLGIAGMLGSGRTELLKSIFGADKFTSGEIVFENQEVSSPTPSKMRNLGFALTPENRKSEGLIQILPVYDNLCVASLDAMSKNGFVQKKLENSCVEKQVEDLQIKISSSHQLVSSLSGGNQQKVVVGNWLNTDPKIMMFDEPSRGIDVNAKQQIFQIIWGQSRKGISSIIVSSELEELIEVCHRILIMCDGKIVDEVYPEDISVEELYARCMES